MKTDHKHHSYANYACKVFKYDIIVSVGYMLSKGFPCDSRPPQKLNYDKYETCLCLLNVGFKWVTLLASVMQDQGGKPDRARITKGESRDERP